MDIFAHGFWTNAIYQIAARKVKKVRTRKEIWLAIFFGVAPDLFSFGIYAVANIIRSGRLLPSYTIARFQQVTSSIHSNPFYSVSGGPPDPAQVPAYVHVLYDYTHSLVIFLFVFLLIWLLRRRPYWLLAGWGLHILIDIFTHTERFFPTPLFFPLSSFHFSGISWADPVFMLVNYLALVIVYLYLYKPLGRRKKKE